MKMISLYLRISQLLFQGLRLGIGLSLDLVLDLE